MGIPSGFKSSWIIRSTSDWSSRHFPVVIVAQLDVPVDFSSAHISRILLATQPTVSPSCKTRGVGVASPREAPLQRHRPPRHRSTNALFFFLPILSSPMHLLGRILRRTDPKLDSQLHSAESIKRIASHAAKQQQDVTRGRARPANQSLPHSNHQREKLAQ